MTKGLTSCVSVETGLGWLTELVLMCPSYEAVYNLEIDDGEKIWLSTPQLGIKDKKILTQIS